MFFADAWILWLLVPAYVAWAALWVTRRARRRDRAALRFSGVRLTAGASSSLALRLRPAVEALRLITVGLFVLALARPVTGRSQSRVTAEGIDIMLAIDTSGSMRALDLDADKPLEQRRNRLEVVRDVVSSFIAKRRSDQIGMVVFGEHAFTQSPLTLDRDLLDAYVARLQIGMAGDATAVGDAIGTAVKRLKDSPAKSKVVVLLTDGRSNAGALTPAKAAEVAKTYGIKVYTIGAGSRGRAPIIVQGFLGPEVRQVDVDIDEEGLQSIAETTGAAYFRAEDAQALAEVYARIDALERTELSGLQFEEYDEHYAWLVGPGLVLLLVELVLLGTRLRKVP